MSENMFFFCCQLGASLVLAPLMQGIINRVKAIFAGRHGKPLLQTYYDLWRLWRKSEVIGQDVSWVFLAGPAVSLGCSVMALALLPLGGIPSPLGFCGDFLLAAYFLGMGRFATMLAALDTGSSFEGMGTSREAAFGALGEPAMFIAFMALSSVCLDLGRQHGADMGWAFSLSAMFNGQAGHAWALGRPELILAPAVFFILLLAENCRIPVDDPNTHLELTMIHEVMILDHSGPNLAMIIYGVSLKLWFFAALVAALLVPPQPFWPQAAIWLAVMAIVAILVGIVESVLARLRLLRVPQLLGMAAALAALGLVLAQAG